MNDFYWCGCVWISNEFFIFYLNVVVGYCILGIVEFWI